MSTASLRRDHDLIEKVIKSMETTVLMLRGGAIVPESILMQVMDFATNFTDTCHHSKEAHALFCDPSLHLLSSSVCVLLRFYTCGKPCG